MNEQEDCLKWAGRNDGLFYRLFHLPVEASQKNELDCMQFNEVTTGPVNYHEHSGGYETFLVSGGKFECYCNGRGFIMEKGDILHIQPWMGHSFTPIARESKLNIMFQGINQQLAVTEPRLRIQGGFPGLYESPEFKAKFTKANQGFSRTAPAPNMVEPALVDQLRKSGRGIREHDFKGIKLHQKIARYETAGEKEVWDLFLKAGFFCDWDAFLPEYHVFYVTAGKIRCQVKKSPTESIEFDAYEDCIVFIPPWTPFKFEVIEDVQMYDLDCAAHLQDLCEEVESYKFNNPSEKIDAAKVIEIGKKFNFNATDFGFKD
jgi:mannose-6-phosphate isomerase-like protein (cupin superfamily)